MNLILIGTNHKYSDIGVREKLFVRPENIVFMLRNLLNDGVAKAAIILSTCNRTEIYAYEADVLKLKDFFYLHLSRDWRTKYIYIKEGNEVIDHLFNVAAGLDSQVLGEGEILRQIRDAYLKAKALEVTNAIFNKLFERALFVGKLVRSHTRICYKNPSIAQAAVDCAHKIIKDFFGKNIFILGSGVVAQNLAKNCLRLNANCIIVANRTWQQAQFLAQEVFGRAIQFSEFYKVLSKVDILFSATASPHLILKKAVFQKWRKNDKPLLIFDLAMPRDIDPDIAKFKNVTLFNLDNFNNKNYLIDEEILSARFITEEKAQSFINKEGHLWNLKPAYAQAI